MNQDNGVLADLKALGLSVLGSRLYLALLQRDEPITGYELAKVLGVARANVYDALRGLVQAGFARQLVASETGTLYEAVPFALVGEAQIHDLTARVERLRRALPSQREQRNIWQGLGWNQFQQQVGRAIQGARDSVRIGTSAIPIRQLESVLTTAPVPITFGCWDDCPEPGCGVCKSPVKTIKPWTQDPACLVLVDDRTAVGSWGSVTEPTVLATDYPAIVSGWRTLVG